MLDRSQYKKFQTPIDPAMQDYLSMQHFGLPNGGGGGNALAAPSGGYVGNPTVSPMQMGGNDMVSSLMGNGYGNAGGDWLSSLKGFGNKAMSYIPDGFLDSTNTTTGIKTGGWGNPLLSAATGLGNIWNAKEQLAQQKEQFAFSKAYGMANLNNSVASYNQSQEERKIAAKRDSGIDFNYTPLKGI